MNSDDELIVTPLDARLYQTSNETERQEMIAEWLERAANAELSEDDKDVPPNERAAH